MPQTYVSASGDTFATIATRFYSDAELAEEVAAFNGYDATRSLVSGTRLTLPDDKSLLVRPTVSPRLPTPDGFEEVLSTFGDIRKYVNKEGRLDAARWEGETLGKVTLPFAIKLGFAPFSEIRRFSCHQKLVTIFRGVFDEIAARGLESSVRTFDGCYHFRAKRTSGRYSTHSWGIAIDLNASTNPQGGRVRGDMDPAVAAVFRAYGFQWGGDFSGKSYDPMHFQFCTGY